MTKRWILPRAALAAGSALIALAEWCGGRSDENARKLREYHAAVNALRADVAELGD